MGSSVASGGRQPLYSARSRDQPSRVDHSALVGGCQRLTVAMRLAGVDEVDQKILFVLSRLTRSATAAAVSTLITIVPS